MAVFDIGWATIAPNSNFEWFIHGWSAKQAVTYSIVVFGNPAPGVPNPLSKATLTQGQYYKHVDGTFAQKVFIQNNAPFNPVNVHLLAQVESL